METVKAGRKFAYDFLNLPHHTQLGILLDNGLVTQEEIRDNSIPFFTTAFFRAKEQGKMDALVVAVNKATFDREQENLRYNPPKPVEAPKPKFRVTPYRSIDKRIEITGPDQLRFFVDYDDVNQKVVDGQLKYMLELLEKQWTYVVPDSDYEHEEEE